MTGQAAGFWKVRHAVIGLAVVGSLVLVIIRSCSGDAEDATQNTATEVDRPRQGVYVQVPASQLQPRYADSQRYPQPAYAPQPAYGYAPQAPAGQQQPAYGYAYVPQAPAGQQQQPAYGYPPQFAQPPVAAVDPDNPWSNPAPRYPQPPAQWGQPQPAPPVQVQQWGQTQQQQAAGLSGDSRYRPLDTAPQDPQPRQSVATVVVPAWTSAPYDRRGGSSFGNTGSGAWGGGSPGYGYIPGYGGSPYGTAPYGYPAPGAYPGTGWPGRW